MGRSLRRIAVLGRSGQLGSALLDRLRDLRCEALAPTEEDLDLTDVGRIEPAFERWRVDAVVNAAAFTDVGAAELPANRGPVLGLNRDAPAEMARVCRRMGVPFAHVSTDFVFDGESRRPYREDDPPHPIQEYGRSKLEGERGVIAQDPTALVVRTSTVFGPVPRIRPNYVDAILEQARRGGDIAVVELPISSPTYAPDLAEAILALLEVGRGGLVHVVNDGACSRLELARATVEAAGLRTQVRARPAPENDMRRPAYSALDTTLYRAVTGRAMRQWRDALRDHVARRLA